MIKIGLIVMDIIEKDSTRRDEVYMVLIYIQVFYGEAKKEK